MYIHTYTHTLIYDCPVVPADTPPSPARPEPRPSRFNDNALRLNEHPAPPTRLNLITTNATIGYYCRSASGGLWRFNKCSGGGNDGGRGNGGGGGNQEDEEAVSCEGVVFTNAFRTTSVRSLSQRNLCKEMAFLTSFSEAKLTIAELSRLSAVRPRCLTTIFVGQMSSSRNKLPTTPFDTPCGKHPTQTANGSHMRSGIVP